MSELTEPKRYTVTAALPYTNGGVHIGHLAGVYVPADIYVRYLRMRGRDVIFVCGSDENGVPITLRARKEGITPQQLVDKYHKVIGDSFRDFGISFDIYHRTSSQTHKETAQAFFKNLYDKGIFTEQVTEQYYDAEAKQFLADRYIMGTCPKCGNEGAYGDQCEKCGSTLNATDLINPKSTLSGAVPVLKETKNWFLPLDKFESRLREYIESKGGEWKANVYGQCMSWLNAGLQPRAMTRDLSWGVEVPLPDADGKVLYVWFDAPIGYISATKDLFDRELSPETRALYYMDQPRGGSWEPYWEAADTKLVHFIGKDNIVFHCIIFPAMLMAHGDFVLAENVPANEFLNLEGNKISTSRNWAVWLDEYLQDFAGKQDVLRYVLTAAAPETKDNDFTWKDFQQRNNSELVAILGNFVNRVTVLCDKYYRGEVPAAAGLNSTDRELLAALQEIPGKVAAALEEYKFREALAEAMGMARLGNKYLADEEPWKKIKTDAPRVEAIMFTALEIAARLALLIEPFMPFIAAKLQSALGLAGGSWAPLEQEGFIMHPGYKLQPMDRLLFEKIEDEAVEKQMQKLETTKEAPLPTVEPLKPNIDFDLFSAMDMRIATIMAAEKIEKAKKLLKLTVNTGVDTRTVVSGIAEYYTPEELVGKQVCMLANLAPKMLRGVESSGMILMADDADGKPCFVAPHQIVPEGSIVR